MKQIAIFLLAFGLALPASPQNRLDAHKSLGVLVSDIGEVVAQSSPEVQEKIKEVQPGAALAMGDLNIVSVKQRNMLAAHA